MLYDIFLVGNATMDFIFTDFPRMPILGEDTFAEGFEYLPGESFTNAITMHRLGLKVAWAADFGTDLFSKLILEEVRKEGLSEEFFVFHDRPIRRVSVAISMREDRAFLTHYDREPSISAAITALTKVHARVVFIPGLIHGAIFNTAIPIFKLKKMRIVMDGNCQKELSLAQKGIIRSLKSVDVFLPNAKEALNLTGCLTLEEAAAHLSQYCPLVVIKDGANGSIAIDREQHYQMAGIPVDVTETTGAGDSYSSGFVKAMLDGKGISECLAWGNICGGLSTQGFGGTSERITQSRVAEYFEKYYGNL